jgi:hypothetical protein
MKHAILATTVALACFLPVPALRAQEPSDPVSLRLAQIDLDVATRQYEKLRGMLQDSRLELLVNDGALGEAHPVRTSLEKKIAILEQLSDETRGEILKLGQILMEANVPVPPYRGKSAPVRALPTAENALQIPGITSIDPAVPVMPPSPDTPGGGLPPIAPVPAAEPSRPPQPPTVAPARATPGYPGGAPTPKPAPAVPGASNGAADSNYLPPATTPAPVIPPPVAPALESR